MNDPCVVGGVTLKSRLFIGTGKYSADSLIPAVAEASGAEVITVAMRRVEKGQQGIMGHIPKTMRLLPNTSGARTADEAVRLARLARAAGCGDWVKIEVISDTRHLLPDGYETAKATEILVKEGFTVLPYINPDLCGPRLRGGRCLGGHAAGRAHRHQPGPAHQGNDRHPH